jgi:hypothetical protein
MGYFQIYNTVGRHFVSTRASSILTKIVPEYAISPIQTTYPAHLNLLKVDTWNTLSLII